MYVKIFFEKKYVVENTQFSCYGIELLDLSMGVREREVGREGRGSS
jgi:hypothetical protein